MSDKPYPTVLELQKRVDELWKKVEEHFAHSPWAKPQPVASTSTRTTDDIPRPGDPHLRISMPLPQPVADDAAEYRRLCAACWHALGISTYDGRSIPEHIESLRAELAAEREHRLWQIGQCAKVEGQVVEQRDTARERVKELEGLLVSIRYQLSDRVPPDCNERLSMVNRIDAALGKDKP